MIEIVFRVVNVKFEIGEVGFVEFIVVKGKYCCVWIEKNVGMFV